MTRALRLAATTVLAVIGLLGASSSCAPAGADPIGSCTTTIGTIVAVDFSHWGGPVVRGCGIGDPSGYALLRSAGFTTTGDSHDGPGFICRIANPAFQNGTSYPTAAQDPCIRTPPTSAYWTYWVAPAGRDTWSYSARGALSDVPSPGEVQLWTFGGTDTGGTTGSAVPTLSPDSLRAHNPVPVGVTVPRSTPTTPNRRASTTVPAPPASVAGGTDPNASPSTVRGVGVGASRPSAPADGSTASATGTTEVDQPTTSVPGSTPTTRPPIVPRIVDALPAVHEETSTGSVVPLLVAVGLLVVLGGGAAGAMWRRRSSE